MPSILGLTREQLKSFLPDHQSIRSFEQLQRSVAIDTPETIDQANNNANSAYALATAAMAQIAFILEDLENALNAPVSSIGTIGYQNADEVEVTGGSIDGTPVGVTVASAGAFTTLSATLAVTLNSVNANVSIAPSGTGSATINPATVGTINNMSLGATTAATVRGTTVTATGAFGCNGKTAQTSAALAAAATDLPTVIALANSIRTALINNGIGS